MNDKKYPIGPFRAKENYSTEELSELIDQISELPEKLSASVHGFSQQQLDTPYREGGWTVRQVIHHLADSHLNSYIRFKWTLTEDQPVIKAYNEKAWAVTAETQLDPSLSINFLKSLHAKWTALLKLLSKEDLNKAFIHPESGKAVPLNRLIALYAWHGNHHLAHITSLKEREGWK